MLVVLMLEELTQLLECTGAAVANVGKFKILVGNIWLHGTSTRSKFCVVALNDLFSLSIRSKIHLRYAERHSHQTGSVVLHHKVDNLQCGVDVFAYASSRD